MSLHHLPRGPMEGAAGGGGVRPSPFMCTSTVLVLLRVAGDECNIIMYSLSCSRGTGRCHLRRPPTVHKNLPAGLHELRRGRGARHGARQSCPDCRRLRRCHESVPQESTAKRPVVGAHAAAIWCGCQHESTPRSVHAEEQHTALAAGVGHMTIISPPPSEEENGELLQARRRARATA